MFATKKELASLTHMRKRADFLHAQKKGKKWVSKSLILQAVPNEDNGKRFGLTVSKKVSKSAVTRNRIRRRLRAGACDILPSGAKDNTDYVLIGRPDTLNRPYEDIRKDLKWCLRRMGLEETAEHSKK